MWESDTQLEVHAASDGLWNGVAFWFEVSNSLSCCIVQLRNQGKMHNGPAAKKNGTVSLTSA